MWLLPGVTDPINTNKMKIGLGVIRLNKLVLIQHNLLVFI